MKKSSNKSIQNIHKFSQKITEPNIERKNLNFYKTEKNGFLKKNSSNCKINYLQKNQSLNCNEFKENSNTNSYDKEKIKEMYKNIEIDKNIKSIINKSKNILNNINNIHSIKNTYYKECNNINNKERNQNYNLKNEIKNLKSQFFKDEEIKTIISSSYNVGISNTENNIMDKKPYQINETSYNNNFIKKINHTENSNNNYPVNKNNSNSYVNDSIEYDDSNIVYPNSVLHTDPIENDEDLIDKNNISREESESKIISDENISSNSNKGFSNEKNNSNSNNVNNNININIINGDYNKIILNQISTVNLIKCDFLEN